jgi:DNA-binding NtrC family response regulator
MQKNSRKIWLVSDDNPLVESIGYLESSARPLNLQHRYSDELSSLEIKSGDILMVHVGDEGISFETACDVAKNAAATIAMNRVIMIDDDHSSSRGISLHSKGLTNYLSRPLNLNQLNLILEVLSLQEPVATKPAGAKAEKAKPQPSAMVVEKSAEVEDHGYLTSGGGQLYDSLLKSVLKVSKLETTILLTGETGTGKSHLARVIHHESGRAGKPIITINCAAISPQLFESELFGHVRGSFTGADSDRVGKLTEAAGGTIFLDEIDSLPLHLQAKLLRVFEEKVYEPVGSNKTLPMQARLVVASNRDLKTEVAEGRFRSDLFYRLNVVSFEVPPLRSRKSIVKSLLEKFLAESSTRMKVTLPSVSADAQRLLDNYDWPGNIRELRNVVERAVALCDNNVITPTELTNEITQSADLQSTGRVELQICDESPMQFEEHSGNRLNNAVENQEREMILESVNRNGFNLQRTARDLGISRMTLYKKLDKYQIQRKGSIDRQSLLVSSAG